MADDPLANFRTRKPTPLAELAAPAGGKEPYRAFASRDKHKSARIDIRPKDDLAHSAGYNYLIEIVYDRRDYTAVMLVFSTLLVKMRGRGLRPIVDSIRLGSCDYVAQFDERDHDAPDDASAPFIDHMEVVSAAAARDRPAKGTVG